MSLWNLYLHTDNGQIPPSREKVDECLSGNLCRCTGYRSIIDAAGRMGELPPVALDRAELRQALQNLQPKTMLFCGDGDRSFYAPRDIAELVQLRREQPEAVLLAGSTDIGLWVTKKLQEVKSIIYLGQVAELKAMKEKDGTLQIGAGVTLTDAYEMLCQYYPAELTELRLRFASLPIRNAGTLGGNVANGSPIGDSMPWLIALGAQIVLHGAQGRRSLPLENFYLDYQKKDLRPDEFVEMLHIPLPAQNRVFRTYKLAKRFDQDISAVCAAFSLTHDNGLIREARVAYGGMAATPKRATRAEAALTGQPWNETTLQAASAALEQDYAPLTDMRASSSYRMRTAQNLLRRFWLETRPDVPLPAAAVNPFTCA